MSTEEAIIFTIIGGLILFQIFVAYKAYLVSKDIASDLMDSINKAHLKSYEIYLKIADNPVDADKFTINHLKEEMAKMPIHRIDCRKGNYRPSIYLCSGNINDLGWSPSCAKEDSSTINQ